MANFQIGFSGKLLYKETIESIKKDLSKISTGINEDSKLQLVAKLNTGNTIKIIQQQLKQISSQSGLKVSVDLDFLKGGDMSSQFKNLQNASKATAQSFSQVKSNIQGSVAEINTLIKKEERFNAERVKVGATETYQTGLGKTTKINYSAGEETSSVIVTDLKQANKFQEQLNEKAAKYIRNIKAAHEINKDTNSSRSVSQEENIQKLNAQYDKVVQKVEQYKNSTLETASQNKIALEDEIKRYETLSVELKNVEKVAQNLKPISITSAKTDTINQLNTFLAQIDSQALKTGQDFSELKQRATVLKEELSNVTTPTGLQTIKEKFSNLKTELQSLQTNAKLNLDTTQATISADTLKNRIATLQSRIDIWLKNNPRAAKLYASQLLEIKNALGQIDASAVGASKEVTNLNSKFNSITRTANITGNVGKGFLTTAKEKITKFAGWYGITGLIMSAQRLLTDSVDTVIELDTALVDLAKTTKASGEELEHFYYTSNDIAKQLGVTTQSVIQATADWSRLGYSIKEAQEMSKNSSIFASISPGVDINKATDGLVSIMKAFKINADDSLDGIISKINIIGNTQGVSNGDVIDFLERSSASMSEANNTLEETIALGTAATEITRDASAVGNMLKTVSMRIRGYDEETETYTGDVEVLSGKIADLTKTAQNPTGISLFKDKDKTEFKSTVQLLRDIHKIYGDLTDKQQAGLLEALAGKRQGQGVAAILNNFDAVEKSLKTMENSAGNAMEEMDVIKKSTSYHINAFKETLTGIFQNSWGRDTINNVVDFGTKILNIVDTLTDKFGLLGGVITPIITAVLSIKNKGRGKLTPLLNMLSLNYNNELMIA